MSDPGHTSATFPLAARLRQILQLVRLKPFDVSTAAGRSAERHRRIALSSLAAIVAKFVGVLSLLVTVPLTIKYLGAERYGLWMTISSVIAMFAFADLGIGMALINILSEANGRDDLRRAQRYVSSAWLILTAIGTGIILVFLLAYPFVPWGRVFNLSSPQAIAEAGPALLIFAVIFAIGIPLNSVPSIQSGYQHSFVSSIWLCVGNIVSFVGILLCVWFHASLPWLVFAMSGGLLLSRIIETIVLFTCQHPGLRPRMGLFEGKAAREVLKLGSFFFVLGLTMSVAFTSDSMVITQVLGPEKVTEYSVTYRLFSIVPVLLGFVMGQLWPAYGEAAARGDMLWVRRTLRRSFMLALLTSVPPAIFLTIFGKPIVYLWSRHEVVPGNLLLIGQGLWTIVGGLSGALAMFLNGLRVIRFQIICSCAMAVMNLILSILLTRAIGVAGVIFGTVISMVLCIFIPNAVYVPRLLSARFAEHSAPPVETSG